jgi:hypothetical protein
MTMNVIHPFDTISRLIGLEILLLFVVRIRLFSSIICSINHNQFNHVFIRMSYFLICILDSSDEIHIDKSNILLIFMPLPVMLKRYKLVLNVN